MGENDTIIIIVKKIIHNHGVSESVIIIYYNDIDIIFSFCCTTETPHSSLDLLQKLCMQR